ncbi:hypothetical protein [Botrimarina hoheduenensis]|uniref:Uncharacterized protein n=1 Tax=Botrimarina hoheduenensis TaxID=2528000 RepID=A0A5C5WB76_9BACT|nr:hypothetical protein [Botrimarina hoheduenensis]TWT47415.1 hypothetical protein Pla111_10290 [Botrimarina hoheduenensis]
MNRSSRIAITLVLLLGVLAGGSLAPAKSITQQPLSLGERLVTGLQVRRPGEFTFIDAVVDTVERGELPRKLVDGFFFWSRSKARSKPGRRGIIYFQPALEVQAKRLGVTIRRTSPQPSP